MKPLIRRLHNLGQRARSQLSAGLPQRARQACVTREGLKILCSSSHPLLAMQLNLWFGQEGLTKLRLSRAEIDRWEPDLILETAFARSYGPRYLGLVSRGQVLSPPLRTQPYLDMQVGVVPDFERFLMDVMPKKRRAYIRKALLLPLTQELSRDPSLLKYYLDEILHPATEERHGRRSQLLRVEDVLSKGAQWELQLVRDGEGNILGGNLLIASARHRQLRLWRQAVHPLYARDRQKHDILTLLNSIPLELACKRGLRTVSFGVSPHRLDDPNFYSKRLWACLPRWNPAEVWVQLDPRTEAARALVEGLHILCARPGSDQPDAVLVPRPWLSPAKREELGAWLKQYATDGIGFVATLHGGVLRFESVKNLLLHQNPPEAKEGSS